MSSGSYFVIYRNTGKIEKYEKDSLNSLFHENYKKDCEMMNYLHIKEGEIVHPKFYDAKILEKLGMKDGIKLENNQYLDSETGEIYYECMTFRFPSILTHFRDEIWNLSPYDPRLNYHVVSRKEAREILLACDYLLLGHYDVEIEKIMNNPHITELGYLVLKYSEFKYKLRFPEDNSISEDEDNSYMVEEIRTIMNAFLCAEQNEDESEELKLVYWVW